MRGSIAKKTELVNRLKGLLAVKASMNNLDNFFSMVRDKFGLSTMRPDAKVLRDSILKQIEDTKKELARVTKGLVDEFNDNLSDAETLKYLDSAQDIVHISEKAIQGEERSLVYALANRAINQSYYDQFEEGLVKDKSGKWVYNPKQYKKQQNRQKRAMDLLRARKFEEYKKFMEEEDEYEEDESSNKPSRYQRRVQAIQEAR